jgi:hypothetical protein
MSTIIQLENKQLHNLAKCWNTLDTGFIEDELAEDVVYESQWVFQPMHSKVKLLSHLNLKFQAIKESMQSEVMNVSAEIALLPSMSDRPCIVLTQMTAKGLRQATVLVQIRNKAISRIDVCCIPNPSEAKLTGEFPR